GSEAGTGRIAGRPRRRRTLRQDVAAAAPENSARDAASLQRDAEKQLRIVRRQRARATCRTRLRRGIARLLDCPRRTRTRRGRTFGRRRCARSFTPENGFNAKRRTSPQTLILKRKEKL